MVIAMMDSQMKKPAVIHVQDRSGEIWKRLNREAMDAQAHEPAMAAIIHTAITGRTGFADSICHVLAEELATRQMDTLQLRDIIAESHKTDPSIVIAAQNDLLAVLERDPAAKTMLVPFLFFKGFQVLQSYRVAHWLWRRERKILAFHLQSRISRCFSVDIHPAAVIGQGVMLDHAHGIVVGETAVIEDNVSILHNVTLGGTGKEKGDRHPKIRTGVMIGAGAKILGNIEIGECARVAAGSLVLKDVPPHVTVAGVPARVMGTAGSDSPAKDMDQTLGDEGSSI